MKSSGAAVGGQSKLNNKIRPNIFRKQSVSLKKPTSLLLFSCFLLCNFGMDKSRRLSRNFILLLVCFLFIPSSHGNQLKFYTGESFEDICLMACKQTSAQNVHKRTNSSRYKAFHNVLEFLFKTVHHSQEANVHLNCVRKYSSFWWQTPWIPCWPPSVHLGQLDLQEGKRIEN